MFESVVAHILNKYLGKYVQDLDSENLNVGIFGGTVQLTDLKLKPEALYELDLPIEVKAGCVGKVSIDIPWTTLYYDPVLVHVEDILILAGPIADRHYDPEREKWFMRAKKRKHLEGIQDPVSDELQSSQPRGFVESLLATIVNNVQVSIQNIHIRYEDVVSIPDGPFACGLVVQSLTAITTNSKWKHSQIDASAQTIFKLIKLESLSLYWNCNSHPSRMIRNHISSNSWRHVMKKGLQNFSVNGEDFNFIVKPISIKVKIIFNKSSEAKVPKLLLDFVLQDVASQLSRKQFLGIISLARAFQKMDLNRRFKKFHPKVPFARHARDWWRYAYTAVLEEYVRPYSWKRIKEHRSSYHQYKEMYKQLLQHPADTELKLDLQQLEDQLDITNIVIAREEAKLELVRSDPSIAVHRTKKRSWWETMFGIGTPEECPMDEIEIPGEREKSLWSRLSAEEQQRLYEAIGVVDVDSARETPAQYIAHKMNFTLANCTLSLVSREREIIVITLTQFLTSIETRPAVKAFKVSARTESFVVEGASTEHELVPIMTCDNSTSGSSMTHVFAIDFEKNPLHVKADFGLTMNVEPVEIVYHEHAISQFISYFQMPSVDMNDIKRVASEQLEALTQLSLAGIEYAITKHTTIYFSADLKSPYLVIPEHGTLQKGGSVLVLDMGRLVVKSDLQPEVFSLEDATKMEVEERLYDRFTITFSDIQVLFADSGDEWRAAKQMPESEIHLMPKVRVLVNFSNSVKPDYCQLPRQKLNISIPSFKVNMSDRRVRLLMEFAHNLPLPQLADDTLPTVHVRDSSDSISQVILVHDPVEITPHTKLDMPLSYLKCLKHNIGKLPSLQATSSLPSVSSTEPSLPGSEHYSPLSEHSDDEPEAWARTIDLPGFDDNISPSNTINILLRFLIGEVVIHLARSSDHVDKPYLMLRIEKLCTDVGLMTYGPALQASLGGIQLVDKLHTGSSGEYLELISSEKSVDMITIRYRKVCANCPEFKSHFHQVEHSLVLDLTNLLITFHREAFMTLGSFIPYVVEKVKPKDLKAAALLPEIIPAIPLVMISEDNDPPVPPGATKFSISLRVNEVRGKLCDTDLDLADIKILGAELDYVLKANEKMVFHACLTGFSVDDLMESTLYPKILTIEDDKLFEFKYVKNSSHQKEVDTDDSALPFRSDGCIRLSIGRVHAILLFKFLVELQRFLEPFILPDVVSTVRKSAERAVQQQVTEIRKLGTKVQLYINIHAPTVLVPQKSSSPNLLVLSMGDLSVENFFKNSLSASGAKHVVDNILLRLSSLQLSRAVILLDGTLETQEPILEPVALRLDVKRVLTPNQRDMLLYDVQGSLDVVKVNIGQCDLSTFISIYQDNWGEGQVPVFHNPVTSPVSPTGIPTPMESEDPNKKINVLEAFFNTTEVYQETYFSFVMEGLQLTLYTDTDEVLSSPVRDQTHALSKLEVDEVSISIKTYNDRALEFQCSLQAATLEDSRSDSSLAFRRIFQSYSGDSQSPIGVAGVSISMPPMVDFTYRQTGSGDASVDILVEKTRLNLSVPYIMALIKFAYDALPIHKQDGSEASDDLVGPTIITHQGRAFVVGRMGHRRVPSDSTSGYHSVISSGEEFHSLSVSAVLKKPEIILFADPTDKNSQVLVLKTDIIVDYNRNPSQENIVASVVGLRVLSCMYGQRKQTVTSVLYPCDLEFTRGQKHSEDEMKMTASLSPVDLRLSAATVQAVIEVVEELSSSLSETTPVSDSMLKRDFPKEPQELWTPVKLVPHKWNARLDVQDVCVRPTYPSSKPQETLTVSIPNLHVIFEIVEGTRRIPIMMLKTALESDIHDWSKQMYLHADLQLEVLCYNENVSAWEPILEPVLENENHYVPWNVSVKMFRDQSHPIMCSYSDHETTLLADIVDGDRASVMSKILSDSDTSADNDSDDEMTVIKRRAGSRTKRMISQRSHDSASLTTIPPDSDSETDDGILEKITNTFGHLFSGGSSDEEPSDSEDVVETKSDSGDTEPADNDASLEDQPVFLVPGRGEDSMDTIIDHARDMPTAVYLIINSQDHLDVNVTPVAIKVVQEISDAIFKKQDVCDGGMSCDYGKPIVLNNYLGPEASVTYLKKKENTQEYVAIEEVTGKGENISPITPPTTALLVDVSPDSDMEIAGEDADGFAVSTELAAAGKTVLLSSVAPYLEKNVTDLYSETTKERLSIKVKGFDELQCLMPQHKGSTMYSLQPTKNKIRYYITVDVDLYHGQKIATVRSPLLVRNHFPRPMHIFCKQANLAAVGVNPDEYAKNPFHENFLRLTTLDPDQIYHVPVMVAYHCKLFLQPAALAGDRHLYDISSKSLWSQDIASSQKSMKLIHCTASDCPPSVYCIKVLCLENTQARTPAVGTKLVPNYTLHLYPPVVIHNYLPYPMEMTLKKSFEVIKLEEGDSVPLYHVESGKTQEVKIEIPSYMGLPWKGKMELSADMDEHRTIAMQPEADTEGGNKTLGLSVHFRRDTSLDVHLYSPYWIVNKTSLPLQLRGSSSDIVYDSAGSSDDLLLFRFKKHKHKKAKIRVYNSCWSHSFCLDTVGNSGVVVCLDKERNRKYRFFISIEMAQLQLTKIVTIRPFITIINNTQHFLRFMEENEETDLWLDIAPSQCLPFWPITDSVNMFVKYRDSKIVSQHFPVHKSHTTVLRMDNGSALSVEVTGQDQPITVSFFPYFAGDAPVRVENLCEDLFIKVQQKSLCQVTLLSPYQSVLYTWDDPTVERTLIWNLYNRKKPGFPAQISMDGYGQEKLTFCTLKPNMTGNPRVRSPMDLSSSDDDDSESEDLPLLKKTRKDKVVVYWVSYLEEHQRVLLFTQDERVSKQARKAVDGENSKLECFVSLHGIGLSLINGAYKEVSYLGIRGAPAMWEVEINHIWKLLPLELSTWLEDRWQAEMQVIELRDHIQADLSKMQMTKPFFGRLRRTFNPALWLQFRQSDHQMYVNLKIHRLQVDNQLPDAIFPTAVYPAPVPCNVLRRQGPKPCIEFGLQTHRTQDLNCTTIKYLKLLVQEMNFKLEKGFLLSLYDMFASLSDPLPEKQLIKADLLAIQWPEHNVDGRAMMQHNRAQRTVFEFVHITPVKVRFSFTPRGAVYKARPDAPSIQHDILDFFINSIGSTLTEVKDVEMKMAFFERRGAVTTPTQLLTQVKSHYVSQVIRQAYVLILGLDVLGNPYGLVRDFTQGLGDLFYEPFMGSVQGPEEFAAGLARGAQGFMGHIIGGAAGSVALITGSLGQALSVLSFDDDYKRRRRQRIQQHADSLPEALAMAAKGFVLGVALGLSGVVIKPITGAQQEGIEGFFKGIGKGLLGLITKPTGGVVDMVSMAFDGIRRAAEMGQEVVLRVRLPRFISPISGLKPYSPYQSVGYRLLVNLSKGHYAESDIYWAHAALSKEDRADVALITDRHIFLLEKCRFWGGWDTEWTIRIDDIMSVPKVVNNRLVIKIRQDDSLISFTGDERYVQSSDDQVLEWLKTKIEKVLVTNMEDKPCPSGV